MVQVDDAICIQFILEKETFSLCYYHFNIICLYFDELLNFCVVNPLIVVVHDLVVICSNKKM